MHGQQNVKRVKVVPAHNIKTYGEKVVYLHLFLISALVGDEWSASHLVVYPREWH